MSDRKACEQWMSGVEKSGGFQAWLERQNKHRENESSAGNNKAACNRWIQSMGECCQLVYDTTLVIVCHTCKNFFSMVNFAVDARPSAVCHVRGSTIAANGVAKFRVTAKTEE
ncbi:hypothetical protein DPMN_176046 [Dreissena polymorpha]|uniref:Uncharacterized protein n=1 Tax=Dreissena polymorpha TaxID=45954 RepID=A0A9D4EA72_DREPO|nr:hypothetical protein DPMN_176046 [Dreissena polymorpha]